VGSPPDLDVRRLHQLLSARAYLRAALYDVRVGKLYLDSRRDSRLAELLTEVEELLEAVVGRIDGEVGFMVYGPPKGEADERVQKVMEEVLKR